MWGGHTPVLGPKPRSVPHLSVQWPSPPHHKAPLKSCMSFLGTGNGAGHLRHIDGKGAVPQPQEEAQQKLLVGILPPLPCASLTLVD